MRVHTAAKNLSHQKSTLSVEVEQLFFSQSISCDFFFHILCFVVMISLYKMAVDGSTKVLRSASQSKKAVMGLNGEDTYIS